MKTIDPTAAGGTHLRVLFPAPPPFCFDPQRCWDMVLTPCRHCPPLFLALLAASRLVLPSFVSLTPVCVFQCVFIVILTWLCSVAHPQAHCTELSSLHFSCLFASQHHPTI